MSINKRVVFATTTRKFTTSQGFKLKQEEKRKNNIINPTKKGMGKVQRNYKY
jgi:hypothetical protein